MIASYFPSIYLDKYGDEDKDFARGKPLFLNQDRLEEIRKVWLNPITLFDHQVDQQNPREYNI